MKRVTITLTKNSKGWTGNIRVDGEEFARVWSKDYLSTLHAAMPYAQSVAEEDSDSA